MPTDMNFYYSSKLTWGGGKRGTLSAEGMPEIEVATPPEFQGPHGLWSPEHLFVAAANACLMTTFLAIAEKSKMVIEDYSSSATGTLEKVESGASRTTDETGLQVTQVVIRPRLTLADERDREKAGKVIAKAEKQCLIARSMKTRITVKPEILVAKNTAKAVSM